MANREELGLIRAARSGQAEAQLALGRVYLYGSAGLPKSLPTALHWLDRAAQQGCAAACELIGAHIPAELALQSDRPLARWYEQAWDLGVRRAGLVLAQLLLEAGSTPGPVSGAKARAALAAALEAGVPEAQSLLARWDGAAQPAAHPGALSTCASPAPGVSAARAAPPPALHERLWQAGDLAGYLDCALPQARALVAGQQGGRALASLERDDVVLLSRCARALAAGPLDSAAEAEMRQLRDIAADENDPHCQLAVGLWHARMQVDGKRIVAGAGSANFKKAIRWLVLAGEQGLAEAWYALSRIYIKPEFSQRSVLDAQRYLERAADMGYRDAQLECGNNAWRARRENAANDVRAVYWLQLAAAQGCPQAGAALERIAPRGSGSAFAALAGQAPACLGEHFPLLAARLRLATLFQLSRAEALLLDVAASDQGHCLVIDIRSSYGRSRRRLVAVASGGERRALDEIVHTFQGIDCSPGGPEGNYRQRLYRLKTVLPEAEAVEDRLAEDGDEDERLEDSVLGPVPARRAVHERALAAA
jgi:TPR repeat protein